MPAFNSILSGLADPTSLLFGSGGIQQFINFIPLGSRRNIRDSHVASRSFMPSFPMKWGAIPRPKHLFAIEIFMTDMDANAYTVKTSRSFGMRSAKSLPLLIKAIDRPKVTFELEKLNQYNKVRIVQKKVNYGNVTVRFHDSNDDRILKLFYDYFNFYYGDARHKSSTDWDYDIFRDQMKIGREGWGYNPIPSGGNVMNYFQKIDIYHFFGGTYTTITLVNPKISDFDHDSNDMSEGSAGTEIKITLDYEGIIYSTADRYITPDIAYKFGLDRYFADYLELPWPTPMSPFMNRLYGARSTLGNALGTAQQIMGPIQMFAPVLPRSVSGFANTAMQSTSALASFGDFAFNTGAVAAQGPSVLGNVFGTPSNNPGGVQGFGQYPTQYNPMTGGYNPPSTGYGAYGPNLPGSYGPYSSTPQSAYSQPRQPSIMDYISQSPNSQISQNPLFGLTPAVGPLTGATNGYPGPNRGYTAQANYTTYDPYGNPTYYGPNAPYYGSNNGYNRGYQGGYDAYNTPRQSYFDGTLNRTPLGSKAPTSLAAIGTTIGLAQYAGQYMTGFGFGTTEGVKKPKSNIAWNSPAQDNHRIASEFKAPASLNVDEL